MATRLEDNGFLGRFRKANGTFLVDRLVDVAVVGDFVPDGLELMLFRLQFIVLRLHRFATRFLVTALFVIRLLASNGAIVPSEAPRTAVGRPPNLAVRPIALDARVIDFPIAFGRRCHDDYYESLIFPSSLVSA